MIKVIIADDQMLIREGIRTILDLEDDMEVVGVACNGIEACELVAEKGPTLVVMDVLMPEMDGITALKKIKQIAPETYVLILSTFLEDDFIVEGMASGASGYLLKDMDVDKMIAAIRDTVSGQFTLPSAVASKLAIRIMRMAKEHAVVPASSTLAVQLTDREKELAKYVLKGCNNREIASAMYISEGTVRNYISTIYSKLGVEDRVQAVVRLQSILYR